MEQDKSIAFPKFPGASSYIEIIPADNNNEMKGPDKIWFIDVLFILHSCKYTAAVDDK